MRLAKALLLPAALGLLTVIAQEARADLRGTATRVDSQWKLAGGAVLHAEPRFINDDETVTIALPARPAARPGAAPSSDVGCVSVALIGARGTSFHARAADVEENDDAAVDHGSRVQSVAGALLLERCGAPLPRIVVTSDSGRGAIETVIGWSPVALPPLKTVLPERTGGPVPQAPETGDLPAPPPPAARADVAEARSRRDGSTTLARETWQAGQDGSGTAKITLEAGCHRIEVFAGDPKAVVTPQGPAGKQARRARIDVDAELRDEVDDRLLARDRSDAADASLEACVGETTRASVVFAGALPGAPVVGAHASWPIPEKLPPAWGNEARARMAAVLLARHVGNPVRDAVSLAQGGSGTTLVPIAIEPGGCYLAVAAVVQGTARGIGLRALVGARDSTDDRGASDNAGVVAFCAGARKTAQIEIDARGTSLAWALALFRTQGGIWEVAR